ncbi:MAG: hypothetical protein QM482_09090 [Sulfurospirillum sp.]
MKINVLIASYSKASDIWYITDHFKNKYWKPDLQITLGANGEDRKEFEPEGWNYINNGEDISFSKSLMSYLESINEEYFILMLDDFMILEKVNNNLIKKAFKFIKSKNGVYLRLTPNPKGDTKIDNDFSRIDVKSYVPYITSLQMAIWKKEFLIQLLSYNFSPWEFEVKAGKTKESLSNSDGFYVTNYNFITYTHFVEKGKFYPFLKDILKQEGLPLNSTRAFLSEEDLQNIRETLIKKKVRQLIPAKYINTIRSIMGKEKL